MKTMIENLINGNLTDARKQAKRYGLVQIWMALEDDYGWSAIRAELAARWLKTGEGWQQYCDAD